MRKKKQSAHLSSVLGAEVGSHSLILSARVSDSLKTGSWPRDHIWSRMVLKHFLGFPGGSDGKESTCNPGDLGWEDPLEEGMGTDSSILAWKSPWTEEPGRLQSMRSQRVRHDWTTFTQSISKYFLASAPLLTLPRTHWTSSNLNWKALEGGFSFFLFFFFNIYLYLEMSGLNCST